MGIRHGYVLKQRRTWIFATTISAFVTTRRYQDARRTVRLESEPLRDGPVLSRFLGELLLDDESFLGRLRGKGMSALDSRGFLHRSTGENRGFRLKGLRHVTGAWVSKRDGEPQAAMAKTDRCLSCRLPGSPASPLPFVSQQPSPGLQSSRL